MFSLPIKVGDLVWVYDEEDRLKAEVLSLKFSPYSGKVVGYKVKILTGMRPEYTCNVNAGKVELV